MSTLSDGNDPPDKNESVTPNTTETSSIELNNKNIRPRDSDDELADFQNDLKKPKTTVKSLQTKTSQTLLRNSLLDTNPFAILDFLDSDRDTAK